MTTIAASMVRDAEVRPRKKPKGGAWTQVYLDHAVESQAFRGRVSGSWYPQQSFRIG